MRVIILAAGQGSRLRPLTDTIPKCMVKICGKSMIERQIHTMNQCGINNKDIYIVTGYKSDALEKLFIGQQLNFIYNPEYETTNMVYSMMKASAVMESSNDVIISYGDIIYHQNVFNKLLNAQNDISVIVDDEWMSYWAKRCENVLEDAETLKFDEMDHLTEIGQKTNRIADIQSQYIGLMKFHGSGLRKMLAICEESRKRDDRGEPLWRTDRNFQKMYMTDMLQGLIDEGNILKAVHIHRGWYEIDCAADLEVAENELRTDDF